MKVDGYIRVSKVGGRKGESFISPAEQRKAVEAYAAAHGLELAAWHEDFDQSGGTLDRPAFQAALDRCRTGETGGIIAAKLDRLTRSTVGLGTLIEEARAGSFNLIAVDFGLDLFVANGKLVADVLAAVAEWERTRRGDDWTAARRNAIERGVPNGRAPFGYRKRPDGRFEVVEREAKIVRQAFALRAKGVPFAQIGRPHGWSHSTVRQLLSNEAFLGVARAGEFVNESSHPEIVTREQFDAAQAGRRSAAVPPGESTRGRLLIGLARCGGCGHTLKIVRRKRADGSFVASYFCKDAASEACPDRAYVHAEALDEFVGEWFAGALVDAPRLVDVVAASRELEQAQAEQRLAEDELAAYVETAAALDAKLFRRGLDSRQARLTEAQEKARHLSARLTRLPAGGSLSDLWARFDADERREILGGFVGRVNVRRGASADLPGHVQIVWSDGTVAQDERRVRVAAA